MIGGGDTGSDCVGTANRQGAKKVYQFEILPKPPVWKEASNPSWPAWPNILRTSSSHEEGCERDWSITTHKFTGPDHCLTEGHFARVEWKKPPGGGMKMEEIPGSAFSMKVDLVLLAMGFVHVKHGKIIEELDVEYDPRGNIRCNPDYSTSAKGVFAAGDANTGASLIVRSIFHGREAAKAHRHVPPRVSAAPHRGCTRLAPSWYCGALMPEVEITRFGDPEVFRLVERPPARLPPGSVRIQVSAAGINFADVRCGWACTPRRRSVPFVPGYEVAGVIAEVGAGVHVFQASASGSWPRAGSAGTRTSSCSRLQHCPRGRRGGSPTWKQPSVPVSLHDCLDSARGDGARPRRRHRAGTRRRPAAWEAPSCRSQPGQARA